MKAFVPLPREVLDMPGLTSDGKLLYSLMLHRLTLSRRNQWKDSAGRNYIYFTATEAAGKLGCSERKAYSLFAELKEAELIERKRQGMNKPARVYVREPGEGMPVDMPKDMPSEVSAKTLVEIPANTPVEMPTNVPANIPVEPSDIAPVPAVLCVSEPEERAVPEPQMPQGNQKEKNHKRRSIFLDPILSYLGGMGYRDALEHAKAQISYSILAEEYEQALLDNIVALMAEVACSQDGMLRVSGMMQPADCVRQRLLSLNSLHIQYVLDCFSMVEQRIGNIKAYLLAMLYNAPATMGAHYKNRAASAYLYE